MIRGLLLGLAISAGCASAALAETIRVATYNLELVRKGPGLLLRDLTSGKDDQVRAVAEVLRRTAPDILALQGMDWDHDLRTLDALRAVLKAEGLDYPYRFAARPNSGRASGLDLDGDGRLGEAEDAWGYGVFTGQAGLAVLSRFPIRSAAIEDHTGFLWRDLPEALMPTRADGSPFPSADVWAQMPLSSSAHWVVPITLPDGQDLALMTFRGSPPVFDGPEDRNGRRNHDETRFWNLYLDGLTGQAPDARFVLAAAATMDPSDSDGRPEALRALLSDPRFQDPEPVSNGAAQAPDQGHQTPNAQDTVDWPGVGRMRTDYVLPSADWTVAGAGVFWPAPGEKGHAAAIAASRHRLVWVDLTVNPAP